MNIVLNFTAPSPAPTCGFQATYRQKTSTSYLLAVSSGASMTISPVPGSYEGNVYSNNCDSLSVGSPYGVNLRVPVKVGIVNTGADYQLYISSAYPLPYQQTIYGQFTQTTTNPTTVATVSFQAIFPAGSPIATVLITLLDGITFIPVSGTYSSLSVTGIVANLPYSGSIAHADPALTPSNATPYWIASGYTWEGSPTTLPSFTLDYFSPITYGSDGKALTGTLAISWIQSDLISGGGSPYDTVAFQVYDGSTLIGQNPGVATSKMGLNTATIGITKSSQVFNTTSVFTLKTLWTNGSIIKSLPMSIPPY